MQVASQGKLSKLAEFLWQDILPEEENHETEALLARSSISETLEAAEIVIPEAGRKLFTEMLLSSCCSSTIQVWQETQQGPE